MGFVTLTIKVTIGGDATETSDYPPMVTVQLPASGTQASELWHRYLMTNPQRPGRQLLW